MDQRVVRGIPWTFAGFAGTRVVSIASTIALARLLTPRDFGIAAVGLLATGLLTIFSDLGLGGALVLRERDRGLQGTIFSLLLVLGCALAVIGVAVSVPLAALLGDRQAAPVLAAFSATTAVAGLSWFYGPLLQREFRFKAASIARVLAALMTAVVSVIAAVLGAGVWSFVLGQAAGIVASTIVLVAAAPYHVKPRFKLSAVREAFKSGRGFVLQGSTAYLAVNADYLIIAKLLGPSALGAYSLAFRYAELP